MIVSVITQWKDYLEKYSIKLFNVITLNNLIKDGLIEELNKKGINPMTKEKRIESYLIEMLIANIIIENIGITFMTEI